MPNKGAIRYQDWRDVLAAVLEAQARRTTTPIVIFGLSVGGMLAYDATANQLIYANRNWENPPTTQNAHLTFWSVASSTKVKDVLMDPDGNGNTM